MPKIFRFDSMGATFAALILAPGFLMMAMAFIGFESAQQLILALVIGVAVLGGIWFALARGTYVFIDKDNDVYSTSGFFFAKSIPLSNIVSLDTRGMFAGLMTTIILTYRDKDGELKTMSTMTKQAFRRNDFKNFLEVLRVANPRIEMPEKLLT